MSNQLTLKGNILWNSVGSIIRLACNYLITIAVVRFSHGFDAAGGLALAMSVSSLVSPLAEFRLRTIQVTDVDNKIGPGEYLGLRLVTTTFAYIIGLIYSLLTCEYASLPVVLIYLISTMAVNLIEGFHAIDQSHLRMDYIGKSYIYQGISNLLLFVSVLSTTNSLELSVAAMSVANIFILILFDRTKALTFGAIKVEINLKKAIRLLASLCPLVIAQICSSAVLTTPKQFLSVTYGAAALGIYSSVASPATIVQMGASYIYSPLLGEFAERFHRDKNSGMHLLKKATVTITGITVCLSILLIVFAKPILSLLFGSAITEYSDLLEMALLCTYLTAFAWFFNDLLLSIRDFRGSFTGNVVASIVSIAITKITVSSFGINGVSITGAASYGIALIIMLIFFMHDYHKMGSINE